MKNKTKDINCKIDEIMIELCKELDIMYVKYAEKLQELEENSLLVSVSTIKLMETGFALVSKGARDTLNEHVGVDVMSIMEKNMKEYFNTDDMTAQ